MGETVWTKEGDVFTGTCPHDNTFVVKRKLPVAEGLLPKKEKAIKEIILDGEPQPVDFFEKETKKSRK